MLKDTANGNKYSGHHMQQNQIQSFLAKLSFQQSVCMQRLCKQSLQGNFQSCKMSDMTDISVKDICKIFLKNILQNVTNMMDISVKIFAGEIKSLEKHAIF